MSADPELLGVLASIRDAQREQIERSHQALQMTQAFEDARRQDLQALRNEELAWRAEVRDLNRAALSRYRALVRIYGVLMLLVGAVLIMLWIQAFSH